MTASRFTNVQRYRRYVRTTAGHKARCMHCASWATTAATRHRNGKMLSVRYCDVHAAMLIDGKDGAA